MSEYKQQNPGEDASVARRLWGLATLAVRFALAFPFISSGLVKMTLPIAVFASICGSVVLAVYAMAAIEVLGGFALLIGLWPRLAALILFLYSIAWTFPVLARMEYNLRSLREAAILSGLLIVAILGAGGFRFETLLAVKPGDSSTA